MSRFVWSLLVFFFMTGAYAGEPGETRCGATGYVEEYQCHGSEQFGTRRCQWRNNYQRCANTNRAPACNVGDTKCGADGYVQNCRQMAGDPFWQGSTLRCAVDRDPADNAPDGYGARPYNPPYGYGGNSAGGASQPRVCTPGQQECSTDRQIRRCVMQGGRPAWETVAGSRCGSPSSGMRN